MTHDTIAAVCNTPSLPADDRETPHPYPNKHGAHHIRSLVVDDDKNILNYVAHMLAMLGCQKVETARKKPDVMNKLTIGPYDLVVTDLEMPDINGYNLTHTIKKEAPDIKVIIMTGRPEQDCLEMMASRLVDGWLFKPFGLKELRSKMEGLGLA